MTTRLAAFLFVCSAVSHAQIAVLNGASNRVGQPVSPGSWATAYGNFAGVSATTATATPFPKTLGGVTVTVDGTDAPIYFVSGTQVNFLIPAGTVTGVKPVQVKTSGATVSGTVRLIPAAPGLFVKDAATPPKGAILNQDSTENTSGNLARRGQVIQIFGAGAGELSAAIADGAVAPSSPIVTTRATPQVFIGGVEAVVQFSGMAPQLVGLWQVNAVIPDRAFINGRTPVQVFQSGVDSNEVTIFVAP